MKYLCDARVRLVVCDSFEHLRFEPQALECSVSWRERVLESSAEARKWESRDSLPRSTTVSKLRCLFAIAPMMS
jgi:hypothetical protein